MDKSLYNSGHSILNPIPVSIMASLVKLNPDANIFGPGNHTGFGDVVSTLATTHKKKLC